MHWPFGDGKRGGIIGGVRFKERRSCGPTAFDTCADGALAQSYRAVTPGLGLWETMPAMKLPHRKFLSLPLGAPAWAVAARAVSGNAWRAAD
jgi:hypothetical protein